MAKFLPEITVIIPIHNRIPLLLDTLHSVIRQTFRNYEVLLIDDNSSSESIHTLKKFLDGIKDPRIKLYTKPGHLGAGANSSRSYGLKRSSGKFVKWFDSDDIMEPELLEIQYHSIKKYDLDGVFCDVGVYNHDFKSKLKSGWRKLIISENPIIDYVKTQLAWPTPSGLWRVSAIKPLFPFSQNLTNAQEWTFHFWVLTSDLRIGVVDQELIRIRSHKNSISLKGVDEIYVKSRFKARSLAFFRTIETGNKGKRYLLKSLFSMFRGAPINEKLEMAKIFFSNLKFSFEKRKSAELILLQNKHENID